MSPAPEPEKREYCPRCRVGVEPGHMGDHMYHAHQEDRRKPAENQTPPPPEKREKRQQQTQPKDDGNTQTKKRKSRWFDRPE
jgi:hypothetical protein